MREHLQVADGKVLLSPLAILFMTLLMPFIPELAGHFFKSGTEQTMVQTKLESVSQKLDDHLKDAVHRGEFEDVKEQAKGAVTKDEFTAFETLEKERHDEEMQELQIIETHLAVGPVDKYHRETK